MQRVTYSVKTASFAIHQKGLCSPFRSQGRKRTEFDRDRFAFEGLSLDRVRCNQVKVSFRYSWLKIVVERTYDAVFSTIELSRCMPRLVPPGTTETENKIVRVKRPFSFYNPETVFTIFGRIIESTK